MTDVTVVDRTGARHTFPVRNGERILYAGLQAGVGLPYECATGTCGSCKARLIEGETAAAWRDAPGAGKCRSGDILMCQHMPAGPVHLKLGGAFTMPPEPAVHALNGTLRRERFLTADAGLFTLHLGEGMDYKAGQFALLSVPGVTGARAYSMTAFAPGGTELEFLIQRKPGGGQTGPLFEGSKSQWPVQLMGPLGRATFDASEDCSFIAIAGGSGIAGILSILDHAVGSGHFARHRGKLYFGLRTPGTSYMLERLSRYTAEAQGSLEVTVAFSDQAPDSAFSQRYPGLKFSTGLVHEVAANELTNEAGTNPVYFVAGPPAMVDAAMRMLVMQIKISPADIRYDRFQ